MKTNTLKYQSQYLFFILILSINFSCKKFVQVDPPNDQVISAQVFTNDGTATSAVLGLYIQMMNSTNYFMSGGSTLYPALSADELNNPTANTNYDPFKNNQLLSSSLIISNNLWRNAYSLIYQANACIEGLTNATNLTAPTKNQLIGEAKFMRALYHFYLLNEFGDVPLETSTDYRINQSMPRIASDLLYDQMIQDLKDAKSLLLSTYPTTEPVRANKWAAAALLARVYLYHKEWANAEAESNAVINSGAYSLLTNLNSVFLADSKEAILQLIPSGNVTNDGVNFVAASATVIPAFVLSNSLISSFETNDLRRTSWIGKNTVSGTAYNYAYKYKLRSGTTKNEYCMLLRFAEQYLIRAEARAQQNNITGANSAESDVDMIRSRAGLSGTTANTQSLMLLAIEKERFTELFTEWGHRWFDLKRTGRIDAVLSVNKTGWVSTAALYPIPFTEIQKNPYLIQNQGYQ